MNSMASKIDRRRRGFTIIELLVAVGVTALLVSLMLTIVVNVMGGWSRSSGTLTSGNQARLVLDQISRDLQSVILKRDSNVWLAATIQSSAPGVGDWAGSGKPAGGDSLAIPNSASVSKPAMEDYRFGQGGVWLRFFSSVPDTNVDINSLSAPRAVSYQIIRAAVGAGSERRYMLFRAELSPKLTFDEGYNLFAATYYTGNATAIRNPSIDYVIANNVVDFGVRFYGKNSAGAMVLQFPKNTNDIVYASTTDTAKVDMTNSGATHVREWPEYADIFVRVLTDEGADQIALMEAPPTGYTAPGPWWDVVLANSRVYTRRIEIKAKSL